jgi:hypothetical protein
MKNSRTGQNIRSKLPARSPPEKPPGGNTNPGGLYDRHGPIPVADVNESDADSVWALFHEGAVPQDGDSVMPTDDEAYQKTVPSPLKP